MAFKSVPLRITAGLPFKRTTTVTLPASRDWWLTREEFEVLSQIREEKTVNSPLVLDLAQFMTIEFDDANVITITLDMTGEDTRKLKRPGHYDIIVSDAGTTDARAIKVSKGPVERKVLVTASKEGKDERPDC